MTHLGDELRPVQRTAPRQDYQDNQDRQCISREYHLHYWWKQNSVLMVLLS